MRKTLHLTALITLSSMAFGQNTVQTSNAHTSSSSADQLPVVKLTFNDGTPILGAPKSLALTIPILCTSDGSSILQGLDPTNPNSPIAIFKITKDKQVILYHPSQLKGISSVQVIDIYPDKNDLIALIQAKPIVFGQPNKDDTEPLVPYIAVFDEQGTQKDLLPLDLPFVPLKIARFPTGEYLAEGRRNNEFALALLTSDGSLNRYIDIYSDLPITEKSVGSAFGGGQQSVSRAALFMYLFPTGDNILLVPTGTNLPIVELNRGGFVRSLKVNLPKDMQLGYFISATPTVWTTRFIHSSDGGLIADGITINDVSAEDGKLLREYQSPLHPGLIACHDNNTFTTFKADTKSDQLLLLESK
jgi:hypothetical protein